MSTTTVSLPRPRRTPRWLRIVLTVVVVVAALAAIANIAWTLLALSARHTYSTTAAYPGVRTLVVDNHNGDIDLVSAPAGTPLRVTTKITRGLDQPKRTAVRTPGGGLRLGATCPSDFNGVACNIDYRIAVPQGTSLLVDSRAGDIGLRDFTSPGVVRDIVKRYSDFVAHPIRMKTWKERAQGSSEVKTLPSRPTM